MFGTAHPKPPHRKEVATQIMQQQARKFESKELVIDIPNPAPVGPPPDALHFEVSYRLSEYLALVGSHVAFLLRHEPAAVKRRRTLMPLAIAVLSALPTLAMDPGWMKIMLLTVSIGALASLPFTVRFWVALLATPVFYLKKRRMPACAFRIDAAGIERTTKRGRRFWRWSDFSSVRRYQPGYLLMCRDGGLPIPVRCLSTRDQERLRTWMRARESARA